MSEEIREDIREDEEDEGLHLLDYLIVLAKHKKLILSLTLPVAIITFVLTLFSNSFYQARTTIFPSQKQEVSTARQFMSQFGFLPARGGNMFNNQNLLVEIIKSRTFTDKIIKKFNLKSADAEEEDENEGYDLFKKVSIEPDFTKKKKFKLTQSPLMKIYVKDQNPQRAADIANAIVDELNNFVGNIAVSEASRRRLFFEKQLEKVHAALMKSEDTVKLFQEKTGILEVKTQTGMFIEKIANLQAQITAKEIELQVMKSYSTSGNPDFQRVNETIKALKKELAKLETSDNTNKDVLISTGTIPGLGLEYKRIFRDLKFNETLYEIVIKQYEAAKLDEAKDAPLIQVIDKAIPPKKKGKVRIFGRSKALSITMLVFFISCLLAFAMEIYKKSSENRESSERIETLMRYLSFKKNK